MKFLVACFVGLCLTVVTQAANDTTAATNATSAATNATSAATNATTATTNASTGTTNASTATTNASTATTKLTTATTKATTAAPKAAKYQVKDANGTVCLEMDAIIVIHIIYDTAEGNKTGILPIPSEATTNVTGTCSTNLSDPEIILSFSASDVARFVFHDDNGNASISEMHLNIRLDKVHFPNATRTGQFVLDDEDIAYKLSTFNKFFRCDHTEPIQGQNATVLFSNMKVQAYGMMGKFSDNGSRCKDDIPSTTTQMTTSSPLTTPQPTPKTPTVNNYTVTDGNNVCVVMDVGLQIKINYNDTKGVMKSATVNIPSGPTINGSCSNRTDILTINFFTKWMLELVFVIDTSGENDEMFSLENITLNYNIDDLKFIKDAQPGQSGTLMAVNANAFKSKAGADGGYKCSASSTIDFDKNKDNQLITSDMKLQAFRMSNHTHIDHDNDLTVCPKDEETNNIVPIAVGAALAALVVIVLIAYLIGRKRSHKGYESV